MLICPSVDPELPCRVQNVHGAAAQGTGGSPLGETAISRGLRRTAAVPLLGRRPFLIGYALGESALQR